MLKRQVFSAILLFPRMLVCKFLPKDARMLCFDKQMKD